MDANDERNARARRLRNYAIAAVQGAMAEHHKIASMRLAVKDQQETFGEPYAHAGDYAEGARASGTPVRVFDDKQQTAAALRDALAPGVVVLLKASRGAAREQVLEGVLEES